MHDRLPLTVLLFALMCVCTSPLVAAPAIEPALPAKEAAKTMVVPDGFQVTLFAAEPDVVQPIATALDDRGRLWVAEALNYPNWQKTGNDRIIVLEDTDGDGRHDKRTVFYDKLNYVTGVEVGFGGVWVMSPPNLLFIADRNGDDKPDGDAVVLLDGFDYKHSKHNIANDFAWGPDGWLYGGHGRTSISDVGKPGTPKDQRIHFDGGVYRYHPTRHVFEAFADGTTNPWGIDFDDWGQMFVANCVTPHLFHIMQGGHYEPWRNRKSSLYAYQRIPTIADHKHWVGKAWNTARGNSPDTLEAGGGHAHCGLMVYLGDTWPDKYRNTVFLCNIHGKRINNDLPRRKGSGYVAGHGKDLMLSRDPNFVGIGLRYGPDGAAYVSDWSDTGECHSYKNTRKGSGRIFKVYYGRPKPVAVDIAKLSDAQLVELQLHKNDWYVRQARKELQERAAAGRLPTNVSAKLRDIFDHNADVTRKLRAMWALHCIGAADDAWLIEQLGHASAFVRGWAVQLLCESKPPKRAIERFAVMAADDDSPFVRLYLACALQRLAVSDRWPIATALAGHAEDASDPNLPLMIWYAVEPMVAADRGRALKLAKSAKVPLLRQFIARRMAAGPK